MNEMTIKFLLISLLGIIIACNSQNQTNMESGFRYSLCEPLNPNIIEKGSVNKGEIIKTFEEFPWNKYLTELINANENEIHYSPSLEFENKSNKNGITASAVGDPGNFEFYIFYKRPKKKKQLFGLIEKMDENYLSDLTGQTEKDVIDCLNALINEDSNFLENKFK